jgi:hypothetical protein
LAAEPVPAQAGVYVYGIFPGDIEVAGEQSGVGEPPGLLRLVRGGDLAALVSDVDVSRLLGTPADLRIHQEILDRSAAALPVLPMRFGAVMTSDEAVIDELLEPHREEFAAVLDGLEGYAQYVVKGRYDQDAILAEVLAGDPEAERLRAQIQDADPVATRNARIALGELVSRAITARREADTRALGSDMAGLSAASLVRYPTHELDAVHVAFLLDNSQARRLEQVVSEIARQWQGRIALRVLGPMAAYDFVGAAGTEG